MISNWITNISNTPCIPANNNPTPRIASVFDIYEQIMNDSNRRALVMRSWIKEVM